MRRFIPAILWTIISYILLTLPGSDIPSSDFFDLIHFDKWVHIFMFGLLSFLWCYPFTQKKYSKPWIFITILASVILYGILMEFVQKYFTRDRSFDITDIIADISGAFLGFFILRFLIRRKLHGMGKNKPL